MKTKELEKAIEDITNDVAFKELTQKEKELKKIHRLVQESEHFANAEKIILEAPDAEKYLQDIKDFAANSSHEKRVKATVKIIQEAKEKLQELENE